MPTIKLDNHMILMDYKLSNIILRKLIDTTNFQ